MRNRIKRATDVIERWFRVACAAPTPLPMAVAFHNRISGKLVDLLKVLPVAIV